MKFSKLRSLICALLVAVVLFAFPVIGSALDPKTPKDLVKLEVAGQTSTTISLKWEMPENETATGFRIFRRSGGRWVKYGTTVKKEATVRGLTPAKEYLFAVRAYNKCSCGKIVWSQKFLTVKTKTAPAAVAKVYTGSCATTYNVTWRAIKGASGYEIYKWSLGKWVKFGSTTGTTGSLVRLIPGVQYKLAVRPYIDYNGGKIYGEYTEFTAMLAPKATKVEASSPEGGKIKITWSKVGMADGYRVFYKYENGSYKVYKDFANPEEVMLTGLKAGNYTIAVRPYMNTSNGRLYGGYTPVKVKVNPIDPTPDCPHD